VPKRSRDSSAETSSPGTILTVLLRGLELHQDHLSQREKDQLTKMHKSLRSKLSGRLEKPSLSSETTRPRASRTQRKDRR
jgi:hypothetical protein